MEVLKHRTPQLKAGVTRMTPEQYARMLAYAAAPLLRRAFSGIPLPMLGIGEVTEKDMPRTELK
jgi:hypothetical protein